MRSQKWPTEARMFALFHRKGKMMPPIQRVNVDLTAPMLSELDEEVRFKIDAEADVAQGHERSSVSISLANRNSPAPAKPCRPGPARSLSRAFAPWCS